MQALTPIPELSPISISSPEPKFALRSILIFLPHLLNICLHRNALIDLQNFPIRGVYEFGKFNAVAINKITNILSMAKFINTNMNVSVICIEKRGVASDLKEIMEMYFMPLFNKIFDK